MLNRTTTSRTAFAAGLLVFLLSLVGRAQADWFQHPSQHAPDGRSMHAVATDPDNEEVVLFGGSATSTLGDTWTWDGDDWSNPQPLHAPGPRLGHAMAWFAAGHRVLLFGGEDPNTNDLDDTWIWNGADWAPLQPIHSPSPRHFMAVAYDVARQRLVLFGGRGSAGALGDTWEFDGVEWGVRQPTAHPSARYSHAMAYDATRGRVVLFGGTDDAGAYLGDTWEYDGVNWTPFTPAASPSPRYGASMTFDEERGTVQLFGGRGATKDCGDVWEWDGTNWSQRTAVSGPTARRHGAMAYDWVRGRVILFGGSGARRDLWELSTVDSCAEIVTGTGAGGGAGLNVFGNLLAGVRPISLAQVPWAAYNQAVGETHPACGNLDGDPWDELVVGLGSYRTNGGYAAVLDDGLHRNRLLKWLRVPWAAYDQADGSTRPACGDLDGDGEAEIVVGLGSYTPAGGYFCVYGGGSRQYALQRWLRVSWGPYNAANGSTRPACGDVDGDGKDEIVIGLGSFSSAGGWTYLYDDASAGYAFLRNVRLDWSAYNSVNGETWPACGDVDRDGKDELLLGTGSFPTQGGQCRVLDDATHNFAPVTWLSLGWPEYRTANGECRPAVGELDGTAGEEVVLGLGRYPALGGYFAIFNGSDGNYARLMWGRVPRLAYDQANGETWPAIGKLR